MASSKNLHYLYNVEYYNGLKTDKDKDGKEVFVIDGIDEKSRELLKCRFDSPMPKAAGENEIELQVGYPGLIVGTGYLHSVGATGEVGLGFSFDYTTGCPYIPGSSVKGVLRSAFEHKEYIQAILGSLLEDSEAAAKIDVDALVVKIFGKPLSENDTDCDSAADTDRFFDAFPSSPGYLLDFENITPHGEAATNEPTPLTLLKIRPGVKFLFSFTFKSTVVAAGDTNITLSPDKKYRLFKQILIDLGAGAKTNVGFGVLKEIDEAFTRVAKLDSIPSSAIAPARENNSHNNTNNHGGNQQHSNNHNQGRNRQQGTHNQSRTQHHNANNHGGQNGNNAHNHTLAGGTHHNSDAAVQPIDFRPGDRQRICSVCGRSFPLTPQMQSGETSGNRVIFRTCLSCFNAQRNG